MAPGNRSLEAGLGWMSTNKLKFNPDKMEVILVRRRSDKGNVLFPIMDGVAFPLRSVFIIYKQVTVMARGAFH